MIISFKCKETKHIWEGKRTKKFPSDIQDRALKKLRMLDAAIRIEDLKIPPSNRLENLIGDREGQKSISINMQWRICFVWRARDTYEVEIIDYH